MSRSRMVPALALAALSMACAQPEPEAEPVDTSAAEAEIERSLAAYRDALLGGDAAAATSYLTDDIRIQEPGMRIGRSEFTDVLSGLFEAGGEVLEFETRRDDLFVHGDAAYEMGEYDEVVRAPDGEHTIRGNYVLRWERGGDGVWRIDRVIAGPREAPEGM